MKYLIFMTLLAAITTFSVLFFKAGKKKKRPQEQASAAGKDTRPSFARRLFPVLADIPRPACGCGPAIPRSLALSRSLHSDQASLTIWEVLLDGEQVHGPLNRALSMQVRTPITSLADVERVAMKYPHREWLVRFIEPLQTLAYQRHGDGQWNLVGIGKGMF